jgi:hypothetical protein
MAVVVGASYSWSSSRSENDPCQTPLDHQPVRATHPRKSILSRSLCCYSKPNQSHFADLTLPLLHLGIPATLHPTLQFATSDSTTEGPPRQPTTKLWRLHGHQARPLPSAVNLPSRTSRDQEAARPTRVAVGIPGCWPVTRRLECKEESWERVSDRTRWVFVSWFRRTVYPFAWDPWSLVT